MGPNWYEVLGVAEGASRQEIRRAYLNFIRRVHPDRNPRPNAAAVAARLNEAYETLSDPEKRALHDARLKAQREPARPEVPARASAVVREAPAAARHGWARAAAALGACVLLGWIVYAAATPPAGADATASAGVMSSNAPDAAGFIPSAYFSSRLLAISAEMRARVDRGESITEQMAEVRALNDLKAVRTWLRDSRSAAPYADLVDELAKCGAQYTTGRPAAELEANLKSKDDLREQLHTQMEADKLAGRVEAFNSKAAVYNQLVEETNAMAAALVARSALAGDLAAAFNRVLDPSLLRDPK